MLYETRGNWRRKRRLWAVIFLVLALLAAGGWFLSRKVGRELIVFDREMMAVLRIQGLGTPFVRMERLWPPPLPPDPLRPGPFGQESDRIFARGDSLIHRIDIKLPVGFGPTGFSVDRTIVHNGNGWTRVSTRTLTNLSGWDPGGTTEHPLADVWVELPDATAVSILRYLEEGAQRGGVEAADNYLRERREDPLAWAMYLDTLVLAEEWEQLEVAVAEFEEASQAMPRSEFTRSLLEHYSATVQLAGRIAEGHDRTKELNRAFGVVAALPLTLEEYLDLLLSLKREDLWHGGPAPYIQQVDSIITAAVPNFLAIQTVAKLARARADFHLLNGEYDEALALDLGAHLLGSKLSEDTPYLISELIGIAVRSIATRGLTHAVINGTTETLTVESYVPALLEAYQRDRSLVENFGESINRMDRIAGANIAEGETRARVAHARLALLIATLPVLYPEAYAHATSATTALTWPPPDPFLQFQRPLEVRPEPDSLLISSVGPDLLNQSGRSEYDPTNGTMSGGDIVLRLPRARQEIPFPNRSAVPATREDILAHYPDGLPTDVFFAFMDGSYLIAETTATLILSPGPGSQGWANGFKGEKPGDSTQSVPATFHDGKGYVSGYVPPLPPPYDPTNGTVSEGILFFSPDGPEAERAVREDLIRGKK